VRFTAILMSLYELVSSDWLQAICLLSFLECPARSLMHLRSALSQYPLFYVENKNDLSFVRTPVLQIGSFALHLYTSTLYDLTVCVDIF